MRSLKVVKSTKIFTSQDSKRQKTIAMFGKVRWTLVIDLFENIFSYSKCRAGGTAECEQDPCLSDDDLISSVNRESRSLGWKAYNYTEFYGRKLKDGLAYRLGTFEPRVRVKSMSRLSNKLESLPKNFDALNHWSGLISDVRDQGWCG